MRKELIDHTIWDNTSGQSVLSSFTSESTSEEVTPSHLPSSEQSSLAGAKSSKPTTTSAGIGKSSQIPTKRVTAKSKSSKKPVERPSHLMNPWTLAASTPPTQAGPSVTKNLSQSDKQSVTPSDKQTPSLIPSSPLVPPLTSLSCKNGQSPLSENNAGLEICTQDLLNSSTPKSVNRRIDFISESREELLAHDLHRHEEPLLPLPPVIQNEKASMAPTVIDISSSPEIHMDSMMSMSLRRPPRSPINVARKKPKEGKKYVMLRDSLPGQWSMAQESQVVKENRRAWRVSQVEVLDLTSL